MRLCFFEALNSSKKAGESEGSWRERLRLGVTLKSVTLGNVTMSHRRERPAEWSLSHSTMIGLPRSTRELVHSLQMYCKLFSDENPSVAECILDSQKSGAGDGAAPTGPALPGRGAGPAVSLKFNY
ncbi:hypothetical protein EVAR_26592_1 [Eumeta japonica]|uniref:Uncharacterized protein n=1 Tax=Eumeta variegata TaxID=151549 RepID=A0A4C1W7Q6_EUMVA|nr:hypothetical protein EVAR_26592_1 [Eumeta japonica]